METVLANSVMLHIILNCLRFKFKKQDPYLEAVPEEIYF